MASKTERAYIAGVFDGEGCVGKRSHGSRGPSITIVQKDPTLLYWIQERTGMGRIYIRNRGIHAWVIGDRRDIQKFVKLIYPYSLLKKTKLKEAYHHEYQRPLLKRYRRRLA